MFPLFLNLTNRLCIVVGGGSVGRRKLNALLESGASVRLVCLENRPAQFMSPRLEWLTQPYTTEHLEGAALVFGAATPTVNERVVRDAHGRGIWVNAADHPSQGDFFVPAMVRRGDFVVAIGTGGAAPALAHTVRELLEHQFDEAYGRWVALLNELRPLVLATLSDAQQRREVFEHLCRWDWLERLRREQTQTVRAAMVAEIRATSLFDHSPDEL